MLLIPIHTIQYRFTEYKLEASPPTLPVASPLLNPGDYG